MKKKFIITLNYFENQKSKLEKLLDFQTNVSFNLNQLEFKEYVAPLELIKNKK